MATKRLKGSVWEFTVRRAGVLPKPVYLRFNDEREGDEYVRRLEAMLDRGVVPDELSAKRQRSALVRDNVARYLEENHVTSSDGACLRVVLERLPGALALADLTFVWATEWVATMKREANLSPITVRHHVGALARALDWLAAHGEIPFNPLRLLPRGYSRYTPADAHAARANDGVVKLSEERDRRLEGDEEARIRVVLAGAKPDDRQRALALRDAPALALLFDLALETAMRMREMYTLTIDQVALERRTIFLDRTKNGDKRQVPLSSIAHARLAEYCTALRSPQMFPWWSGEHADAELRRTTSLLSRQFARIFSAAGCEGLHFHDLRHEATSRLFERTALSDLEIAKITGHKDPRMLTRYANLRASKLADRMW